MLHHHEDVFATIKKYHQEQLIHAYDEIKDPVKKHDFLRQLESID